MPNDEPFRLRFPAAGCAFISIVLFALPLAGQSIDKAIELHTSGRLREALAEYHAVGAATAASDPLVAATALTNACSILIDLGDYRGALSDCRGALRLLGPAGDSETRSRALNNLGLVSQVLGDNTEAERAFREALALNRQRGD